VISLGRETGVWLATSAERPAASSRPVPLYGDRIARRRANGFVLIRPGKGSHEIWQKQSTDKQVTVPKSTKSRHTANEASSRPACRSRFE
jgi:predicted RNA binding protein YcfA (HicA-like mRNA interferase family)